MWGDAHPVLASGIWKMLINQVYFTYGSSSFLRLHVPPARTESTFFFFFFFPLRWAGGFPTRCFSSFYFFAGYSLSRASYMSRMCFGAHWYLEHGHSLYLFQIGLGGQMSLCSQKERGRGGETKRSNCLVASALALLAMNAS